MNSSEAVSQNRESNHEGFLKRHRRWLVFSLIVLGIIFLIWIYSKPTPIKVDITSVQKGLVEYTVANTRAGTVKACRRAKLSPSVGGQITQLPVKEGDHVIQGQLLLSLWNDDIRAQLKLAENEIESAKSQTKAICLQASLSQREAQRLKKLRKSNSVSEERYDDAITRAKIHESDCQAVQSSIKMKEAQKSIVNAALEKTQLVAPFDGVVADISAELSEYVTPSPVGVQTLPVIDLIDSNCFYVVAPIDEVDAPVINVDMSSRISLDAFGDQYFEGKVRRIASYVLDLEKQARTVDVEVEFSQTEDHKKLLAGYSADVEVIVNAESDTLRVPTEAVVFDNTQDNNSTIRKVWVYDALTKTITARKITIGLSNWNYTEVVNGLNVDEKIVLSIDREGLEDGVIVEVGSE